MASAVRPLVLRRAAAVSSKPFTRCAAFSTLRTPARTQVSSPLVKSAIAAPGRIAVFHSSARLNILPPPPQKVEGTANEAVKVPEPAPLHGSYHWLFERVIAVSLIPLTIAPFTGASMHPTADAILCGALVLHSHMGFSSCITDYFPRDRVPNIRRAADWTLLGSSILVAYALWEFETNDVGITEAIRKVWKA